MRYQKQTILDTLAQLNANQIYSKPLVNYKGKTSDTHEYYTEVIAQELLTKNLLNGIPMITRTETYATKSHNKNMVIPTSNRKEEILAIELYKNCDEVLDYQVPLKDKRTDDAGKIDLLLYVDDSLVLGELKIDGSEETLLRAILEVETYYRTVDQAKLKKNFKKQDRPVKKAIIIFENSRQYRDLKAADMPFVQQLLKKLDIGVYIVAGLKMQKII